MNGRLTKTPMQYGRLFSVVGVAISLGACFALLGACGDASSNADASSVRPLSDRPFVDGRDGKTYPVVIIGAQAWMARNLDFEPVGYESWCYDDKPANCAVFGRFYDWPTAADHDEKFSTYGSGRGVCPEGWRLPTKNDWGQLKAFVGGTDVAGNKLRANSRMWVGGPGSDVYGFAAIPTGARSVNGTYFNMNMNDSTGYSAGWWAADYGGADRATAVSLKSDPELDNVATSIFMGISVRCLQTAN